MRNSSTARSAAAAEGEHARPTLRAERYVCKHCQTHTFLVLRVVGSAKCRVCESTDLVPVGDAPAE